MVCRILVFLWSFGHINQTQPGPIILMKGPRGVTRCIAGTDASNIARRGSKDCKGLKNSSWHLYGLNKEYLAGVLAPNHSGSAPF